jgi:hypothetical protein
MKLKAIVMATAAAAALTFAAAPSALAAQLSHAAATPRSTASTTSTTPGESVPGDFHGTGPWTGYIDVAHKVTFNSVTADLKIPAVACTSAGSKASFWIGIWGGGPIEPIEQVGISTDCRVGEPVFRAWLEMYPRGTDYQFGVFPGESVAMSVTYNASNHRYSLALKDLTRPSQKFNQSFTCPSGEHCDNLQAGAILEADNGTDLSQFTTTGFTEFQAITNTGIRTGLAASGSSWGLEKVLMTGNNGKPLATLSTITDHGEIFSLTYKQPT